MLRLYAAVIAAGLLGLPSVGALAQSVAPATGPGATAPDKTAPATDLDAKPGSLSDKLGDTHGVIRPTGDVDPAMPKPAPQTGTMPVLKPGQVPPQTDGKGGG